MTWLRSGPRLDSDTVVRVGESAVLDNDPSHIIFGLVLAKATNADSMSRSAKDFVDGNVGGSLNHTDAVVPGGNVSSGNPHVVRVAYVDAVGVRACSGRFDMDPAHPNVLAVCDENVHSLRVK